MFYRMGKIFREEDACAFLSNGRVFGNQVEAHASDFARFFESFSTTPRGGGLLFLFFSCELSENFEKIFSYYLNYF